MLGVTPLGVRWVGMVAGWSLTPLAPLSQSLFSAFTITSLREMTLGADLPLDAINRLVWTTDTGTSGARRGESGGAASPPLTPLILSQVRSGPVPSPGWTQGG